ncbi:hypothetical protein PpBr36_00266 [Pyricularia pennisetigena]|uniref:hypothetical protein n=1 Tax=Pyricularia pennisetigena TaxID=1578925 RepID=UPI0011541236|nr:hypothetical protein PpBr36_00266 [Pyricularia pennisetigena]TLS28576.1 hypothetical protein PpBr36_00266 [Pyricularia pennisetigena]
MVNAKPKNPSPWACQELVVPGFDQAPSSCSLAIGDSYTAGVGSGNQLGTYLSKTWQCSRSSYAYPEIVSKALGGSTKSYQYLACSGHRTDGWYDQGVRFSPVQRGKVEGSSHQGTEQIQLHLKPNICKVFDALEGKMKKDSIVICNGYAPFFNTDNDDFANKQTWAIRQWNFTSYIGVKGLSSTMDTRSNASPTRSGVNGLGLWMVRCVRPRDGVAFQLGTSGLLLGKLSPNQNGYETIAAATLEMIAWTRAKILGKDSCKVESQDDFKCWSSNGLDWPRLYAGWERLDKTFREFCDKVRAPDNTFNWKKEESYLVGTIEEHHCKVKLSDRASECSKDECLEAFKRRIHSCDNSGNNNKQNPMNWKYSGRYKPWTFKYCAPNGIKCDGYDWYVIWHSTIGVNCRCMDAMNVVARSAAGYFHKYNDGKGRYEDGGCSEGKSNGTFPS